MLHMPVQYLLVGLGEGGHKHVQFAFFCQAALDKSVHRHLFTEQQEGIAYGMGRG